MEMMIHLLAKSMYILFIICLLIIILSFINRLYVLWLYKKTTSIKEPQPKAYYLHYPHVTVQLPIFNERSVVQRLINNICELDYPSSQLEIQVLDDSTDDTQAIARALCEQKRLQGINIHYIHRDKRQGFKAGALQHGLQIANGEFIAIFDSDFLPKSDFLKKTIHFFNDEKIGWVQTTWSHLNENFSLLTQCIALCCDSLFQVESTSRSKLNHWGIFNGTAGIIRRSMIEEAGGWQWDTITEDSDLSYRALAKGWRYVTLTETTCPCELPPTLPVFIEQQTRWSKGNIQVVRKLFRQILSARVNLINKYDFVSYLTNYLFFPATTIFSLLIMPILIFHHSHISLALSFSTIFGHLAEGMLCMLSGILIMFLFFKYGQQNKKRSTKYIFYRTVVFLFMSTGLAPFITYAVFEGFFKKDTHFVRTPKYDITDKSLHLIKNVKSSKKIRWIAKSGIFLGIYALASIFICLYSNFSETLKFLPILTAFSCSYLYFGLLLTFPEQKFVRNIFEITGQNKNNLEKTLLV